MTTLFANNADTQLAVGIDAVQTTLQVLDASEFPAGVSPADPIWVTLQSEDLTTIEIVKCTDISGLVLTVVRGQDGTSASSFLVGTYVEARLVREVFTEIQNDIVGKAPLFHTHFLADVTDSGTAASRNVPAAGNAAVDEAVLGSDTRLTDARTPISHPHVLADVTDSGTAASRNVPAAGDAAADEVVLGNDTRLVGGGGGIPEAPTDGLGYVRDGLAADWHRGAKVFVAATEPPELGVGDFWVET